jgi:hypothetical protein
MLHEPWDGSADVLPQFAQQFKPADPFVSSDDLLSVVRKAARAAVKLPPEEQHHVQQESFAALRAVSALPLVQQCSSVAETHGVRVVVTTCNIPRTANEAGFHTYVYKVSAASDIIAHSASIHTPCVRTSSQQNAYACERIGYAFRTMCCALLLIQMRLHSAYTAYLLCQSMCTTYSFGLTTTASTQ